MTPTLSHRGRGSSLPLLLHLRLIRYEQPFYSGFTCTLLHFNTHEPYFSGDGEFASLVSWTSAVFCPFRTTTRCGPCAVISKVFHLPPAFGIGSTLATSTIAPVP